MFFMLMKGVHDLISKADKSIDIINRRPQISVEKIDGTSERSAIPFSGNPAAFLADFMKNIHHI